MHEPPTIPDISHAPVESWELDRIKPYPKNNKIHSPKQVTSLAKSIASQGLNDPITVDKDGVIISGHGRLMAVTSLGWTKVPVRHLHMLTPDQADKLRIAANKTASTEYDWENLQKEVQRLSATGSVMDDIGFDDKELVMLAGEIGDIDLGTVSADIVSDVEDFEDESREAGKSVLGEDISISKAFGLKTLPISSKKVATRFMGRIEHKTGLAGAEALVKFMEDYVSEAPAD